MYLAYITMKETGNAGQLAEGLQKIDFVPSKTIKYLFLLIPVFHILNWFPPSSLELSVSLYIITKIASVFSK